MSHPQADSDLIRLQKAMAAAGVGSRRACEAMIEAGRVSVDGAVIREQGRRIDPAVAVVHVDGLRVNLRADLVHLAFNKPRGVLSAMGDSRGRPTVSDFVVDRPQRLFHVGRLDADSEGLLLLTNDGPLAHRLTHPSFGVSKTYLAEVTGPVRGDLGRTLRRGVELDDGPVSVDSFRVVSGSANRVMVELVLHEGRNHLVRRLLAEVGHPVSRLVRTAMGPVRLGDLRVGKLRRLSPVELGQLYSSAGP
ncbi:MAG: pseudouridine synthase [Pseudonocardiales bacterium]